MMLNCRAVPVVLAGALLFMALGCKGKSSVSKATEEATVSGTVKVRGQLLNGGEVIFDPSNYVRKTVTARRVPISSDGTYKVTTLLGENIVQLVLPPGVSGPPIGENDEQDNRGTTVEYNSLVFDVKPGDNSFDIEFR